MRAQSTFSLASRFVPRASAFAVAFVVTAFLFLVDVMAVSSIASTSVSFFSPFLSVRGCP